MDVADMCKVIFIKLYSDWSEESALLELSKILCYSQCQRYMTFVVNKIVTVVENTHVF